MKKSKRIAVVGAGISGLTVAYLLKKNGWQVEVIESSSHTGGSIVTHKTQDFLADLGPNSTLETSPVISELIEDIGLSESKIYAGDNAQNRFILKNGRLNALPMTPISFLRSKLFSFKTKFRLLKEPFIAANKDTQESLAEFVKRRLGAEFLDYAINPFVAGVYAGKPEDLSVSVAFPKLHALEQKYGSLIMGAIKGSRERKKSAETSKDRARLFTFKNGMSELTDRLAEKLAGSIHLNNTLQSVSVKNRRYLIKIQNNNNIEIKSFDNILLTVPAYNLSKILLSLDPVFSSQIHQINYAPVVVVFLAYKRKTIEHPLDGFGFLVPEVENEQILGAIWNSTLFPFRCDKKYAVFTVFIGGSRQPHLASLSDNTLFSIANESLSRLLGIESNPIYKTQKKWMQAIPQYNIGYEKFINAIEQVEKKNPGLYLSGNFKGGISVGDCINSAYKKVDKILNNHKPAD